MNKLIISAFLVLAIVGQASAQIRVAQRVEAPAAGVTCPGGNGCVQNAAYALGNDIGGLITLKLQQITSGNLQTISAQFVGGTATTLLGYCFDSLPTGSTFTDKGTFSIAAADLPKLINKVPFSLTTAVPAAGTTSSSAAAQTLALPYNATSSIYCAFVATAAFTPTSTTDLRVGITYVQNPS